MKKAIIISVILLLSCASASAQWYLYPGNNRKNTSDVPELPDTSVQQDSLTVSDDAGIAITENTGDAIREAYESDIPDVLNVALVLPFQTGTTPNANFLEMYSGALLAVKDFGESGGKVKLTVLDETDAETPLSAGILEENHLVVGPVNMDDILVGTENCPWDRYLISPLEPKAAALVDSCRIVQIPVHWKCQVDNLVSWLRKDAERDDQLVIIKDSDEKGIGEQTEYLLSQLAGLGKRFQTVSSPNEIQVSKSGITRCVIASERDPFINTTARGLSVLTAKHENLILYGTSKVRNSSGMSIDYLYNLNTHYTAAYFIDYENAETKDFVLAYRALFKNEPGSFAFQGYDTMHYFLNICAKYGVQWYKKLPDFSERGLQCDFSFTDSDTVGRTNSAVRRVILGKDLSATLQ